jgi:hypothetical protein
MQKRNPFLSGKYPIKINPHSAQARGLLHWWPLQGDHYQYIPDGASGVAVATTPPTRTWSNRGSHFNTANNNFVGSSQPVSFGRDVPITVSGWVRATTNPVNDGKWISIWVSAGSALEMDGNGGASPNGLACGYSFGGPFVGLSQTGDYFDGNWHHHLFTYNSADGVVSGKLYIDGVLKSEGGTSGVGSYSSATIYIGYSGTGGARRWEGDISDIRIYDRDLDPGEVFALYSEPWDLYSVPSTPLALRLPPSTALPIPLDFRRRKFNPILVR